MGFVGSCILRNLNVNLGGVHSFGSNRFSHWVWPPPALPAGDVATGQPLLHWDNVQLKGGDQKCQYVEEMQQDSVERATQALEIYNIIWRRILWPILRKSLTRSTTPPGAALLEGTLVVM